MKRILLSALFLFASLPLFGQGAMSTGNPVATNGVGQPLGGLTVAICNANPGANPSSLCSGSELVPTFTDITLTTACSGTLTALNNQFSPTAGSGCSNPGLTDGQGNVIAFATAGIYWCEYSGAPLPSIQVAVCQFPTSSVIGPSWNPPNPANFPGNITTPGAITAGGPVTIGPSTPPGVSAVLFNQEDPYCLLNPLGYDQLCDQVDLATGSSALSWDPNGLSNQRVFTTAFQSVPYADGNIMCYSAATGLPITCPNVGFNSQNGIETAPAVGISVPTDTGTANAYVACPVGVSAPTVSLSIGLMAYFVALHANTGASTLNWCTTGIQPIKKISSSGLAALLANDINVAPFIVKAVWDGTEWDDIEPGTVSASGGGTVSSCTIHQIGIYNASGNTIGCDANLTDNGTTLNYGSGAGNTSSSTFTSTVSTGTPPFTVSSTTQVANLSASTLAGNPPIPYALDSGSGGNVVITVQGLPTSIRAGLCVNFITASAGNATSTLNVTPYTGATAYGAINLYKRTEAGVGALAASGVDMTSGGIFGACYDGTEWVLGTPSSTAYVTGSLPTDCLALGNSTNQLQGCVPSSYRLDQTGVSTANSGTPQNVASSVSAGHYQFNLYADQSAGCTTVGSGVLTISVGWTDGTHARVGATLTLTPGTAATGTGSFVNQLNDIYVGSSSNLTLTATYTACTTGTWTYDVHAYAVRIY
jgi:hypothetical protein